MDEPGFFGARDHLRSNADLVRDRAKEVAAVLGFACGAGRHCDDVVYPMRFGQTPELCKYLECGVHSLRRERASVQTTGSEAHHLLLAIDDLEREIGPYLHHYHVDRVGADVDRGYAHGLTI